MIRPVPRLPNLALFALTTLLLGTAFPGIEVGLRYLPPLFLAALRYSLAGVVLISYVVATTDRWLPRTRNDREAILFGGTLFIGGTGLTFVGQQYTTGGVAAIIVSLSPVLTALFGWVLLPAERISRRGMVGVLVGLLGVLLLVVRPTPTALVAPDVFGKSLVLLATLVITLGSVLIRRSRSTMSPLALTGWSMLLGATIQFVVALAVGESLANARLTPAAVGAVLYLGVLAGALGFGGYFTLLERLGVLEANLVTYVNPVVAVTVGALLLGESITLASIVGFLVIASGFVLLKYPEVAERIERVRASQ